MPAHARVVKASTRQLSIKKRRYYEEYLRFYCESCSGFLLGSVSGCGTQLLLYAQQLVVLGQTVCT
jgi:hypothetical protein